jgi:hypothetical protein
MEGTRNWSSTESTQQSLNHSRRDSGARGRELGEGVTHRLSPSMQGPCMHYVTWHSLPKARGKIASANSVTAFISIITICQCCLKWNKQRALPRNQSRLDSAAAAKLLTLTAFLGSILRIRSHVLTVKQAR